MNGLTNKMKNMDVSESKINTLFCHSVTTPGFRCRNKLCSFAHNIGELRPAKCEFGSSCRKGNKCTRIHKGESKEEFAERNNFRSRNKLRKPTIHDSLDYARTIVKKLQKFSPIDTNNNIGAYIMKGWGWVEPDKLKIAEFTLSTPSFYNERLPCKANHERIVFVKGGVQQ
jgi:hypothetical protein